MVNGVPREVPRPKPEGPHAPGVFGCGTSPGTPFTTISQAFPYNVNLLASRTSKEGFLSANGLPREYHDQYLSFAGQILVELNPNILVQDVERIDYVSNKHTFEQKPDFKANAFGH